MSSSPKNIAYLCCDVVENHPLNVAYDVKKFLRPWAVMDRFLPDVEFCFEMPREDALKYYDRRFFQEIA